MSNVKCPTSSSCLGVFVALLVFSLGVARAAELQPKSGATFATTYVWNGRELQPKSGATFATTYVWDGRELKTKSGATFATTWVRAGTEWHRKSGATFATTWVVSGDIPVPVIAAVLLKL